MDNEHKKEVLMPVNKMHYSMMTQLFRNPLIFKLKYILGVYDGKVRMSGMVGKACHKALQVYYGGDGEFPTPADPAEARALGIEIGLKYLTDYSDIYIEYGKTGNREKMLANYVKAMQVYFEEEPEYHKILMCEEKMEAELETVGGEKLPLPAVGIPDLVHERADSMVEIIDTKFVKTFTKYENDDGQPHEDYIKIVQSQFLWHLLRSKKKITAGRMVFREVKYTENKTCTEKGCPEQHVNGKHKQVRDYVIPFDHEPYRVIFYNLYKDAINFLKSPNPIYLPNLSDPFDGEQAGLLYAQGLLGSDMSDVEVMHKVKDVAFTSKKFISSRLDQVENKHLNPEEKIKLRLAEFGIPFEALEPKVGTSVTQYQFKVSRGIRMSTIEKHKADIALAIEAKGDIRILAPIPGTSLVGVEVANENRKSVKMTKEHFVANTLSLPIGVDIHGNACKVPLNEMPHLLIAGTTGSGKSILLHSIITALTKQMTHDAMGLILIDPKRVELLKFAKIKHLKGGKIIYKYDEALIALQGLTAEMEARYGVLEGAKCRDIGEYNTKQVKHMPYIVTVVDEFGDLMMQGKSEERKKKSKASLKNVANKAAVEVMARQFAKMGMTYQPKEDDTDDSTVEEQIVRLAQMGRAVGIHLIISTQRPSVDVITGLIKANFPTRIALTTASATDSKVILGKKGAEKLAGKGDMILMTPSKPEMRLQGFYND